MNNFQQSGYGATQPTGYPNQPNGPVPRKTISNTLVIIAVAFTVVLAIATTVVVMLNANRRQIPMETENDITAYAPVNVPKEYVQGIRSSTGYESTFLNMRFTPPEGWTMRTEEEISALFGKESDGERVEMSAVHLASNANMAIITQKVPSLNATMPQLKDALKEELEDEDMVYAGDGNPAVILGSCYEVMYFDYTVSGNKIRTELYLRQQADRLVLITLQALDSDVDTLRPVLNEFKSY